MSKRVFNEAKIENVRKFVRAYGEISGFIDRVDDLQHQISASLKFASESDPCFESVGSILGKLPRQQESIMRKAAWIAQRRCESRAFCVGNHLVQERGGSHYSAVINQLSHLGMSPRKVHYSSFEEKIAGLKYNKTIDGVLVDQSSSQITVIKGCSVDQVKKMNAGDSADMAPSLWVPKPMPAWNYNVPSKLLRGLVYANFILRSAFPDFHVRTILLQVDPGLADWAHRGFDVSDLVLQQLADDMTPLSQDRLIWQSNGSEGVDYSKVPAIPTSLWLNKLPVDRATRCRMILQEMWLMQASSDGLARMKVSDISSRVESEYLVRYTPDWRRHDIEDCLALEGYIERPRFEPKCYVLTPLGVFEALVSRLQLGPAIEFRHGQDSVARTLSAIRHQARLLARYAEGEQVIF